MEIRQIRQIGGGNQGYIISKVQELFNTALGEQSKVKASQGGICYMLSMEWLRRVILEGISDEVVHFNEQQQVDDNLYYYKQIANNYYNYVQNLLAQNDMEADVNQILEEAAAGLLVSRNEIDKLYAELSSWGEMEAVVTYIVSSDQELVNVFEEKKPQYFLLGAGWKVQSPGSDEVRTIGHRMAGMVNSNGQIILYDPNEGVLEINSVDKMLEWICDRYKKFGTPYSFNLCVVRDARPHTSGESE